MLYITIIAVAFIGVFLAGRHSISKLGSYYNYLASKFATIEWSDYRVLIIGVVALIFFTVIICQSLFYPAMDDQSAYIIQGKALYHYKHQPQNLSLVEADNNNKFIYNPSIRPGITSYFAATVLIDRQQISSQSYYSFKMLSIYYYILLFGLFIYVIKKSVGVKGVFHLSIIASLFAFYWILTRMAIINTKEIGIFFFTLVSLFLLDLILKDKDTKDFTLEILLGLVTGINIFINVHGLVIAFLLIFLLLVFSKRTFWQRIIQALVIIASTIFFSAFDLLIMFTNIIIAGVGSNLIVLKIIRFISRNNTSVQANTLISGNGTLAISNKEFYGLTTLGGLYLKGKLQMLTNFGYYGFRGWVMLAAIGICFKKMWGNSFTKLILTFVAIYYLLILDPFNIDRSQNAIVLSGSSDYSALVVFIGLILVGCFSMDIYDFLVRQFEKYKNAILIFFAAIFVALVTTREKVVSALTSRLNLFLSTSKEIGFYQHKVELFVASILILLVIIIILTTISYYKKTAIKVLISLVIFTILIPPFFLFDAGKVPLSKTFSYINESNQFKLEHSLILSDYFTAYYETKKILPPRSDIVTNSSNIMAYNNYFNMSMVNNFGKTSKVYGIGIICSKNNASIAVFNKIEVCELN